MSFDPFGYIIKRRDRGVQHNKIRAQVVDNKDPDGRGRIKARARDIHDNFPDEHLPWAMPHEGFGAGVAGSGKVDVPPIGSYIFMSHQDDSLYHPQYHAGPSTDDKKIPGLNENTPGHVDRGGNLHSKSFGENNDQNVVTDTHQSGTGTQIDTSGKETKNTVEDFIHNMFGEKATWNGDDKTVLTLNLKKIVLQCDELIAPMPTPGDPYKKQGDKPAALPKPSFSKPTGDTY